MVAIFLTLMGCAADASSVQIASPETTARVELFPACESRSHDGAAFANCVIRSIASRPVAAEAEAVCDALEIAQDACKTEWAMRMMNRGEAEDVRRMCGSDAECLGELEKTLAWRLEMDANN